MMGNIKVKSLCVFFTLIFLVILMGCSLSQNKLGKESKQITNVQNENWDIKISLEKTSTGTKPVFESSLPERINAEKINLRILYQVPLQNPTVLENREIGVFSGSEVAFKEKVSLSGVKYSLGTYNVYLKPEINVFAIDLKKQGLPYKYFSIRRIIKNSQTIPIQFFEDFTGQYNTKEVLKITKPNSGLVKGKSPLVINFEGEIKEIIGDNVFQLAIGKQTNEGLREDRRIELPVKNGKIASSFKILEPGTYYVYIKSPNYFPTPQGGGSISWAEFIVEVN